MSFGNFGNEPKPHIGSDFTINQYENAPANYQKANLAAATATLTFKSTSPADYEDSVLTFVSTSGTSKSLIYSWLAARKSTGDIESGAVVAQINGLSTAGAIAAELRSAINSAKRTQCRFFKQYNIYCNIWDYTINFNSYPSCFR